MSRGLLDTSVFIAKESGRKVDYSALPDESAISPVTLAELKVGVHQADTVESRAVRIATVLRASELMILPVNVRVSDAWALLRAHLAGTGGRVGVNDLWIAATALANRIPVHTQDDDFDQLEGLGGLAVVKL